MTDLLVLHDAGAPRGGPWRDAFDTWPGRVLAPDLPGHAGAPPPEGGHHETGDAVYVALDLLRPEPPTELVVVGIGFNAAAAQVLALGGRAAGLVLVDGLGGPWLDAEALDARHRELRRTILSTPGALALPTGPSDPRATLVERAADREFAVRQAKAIGIPTLLVETPASTTPDADELATHFADARLVHVDDSSPGLVAAEVTGWWAS